MINGGGLSGYSGMTMDQMQGLQSLLDDTTAGGTIKRPDGQSTGYSLAESESVEERERKMYGGVGSGDDQGEGGSSAGAGGGGTNNKLVANNNPGAIYVPASVTDRQTLPQPSGARKIVTGTVSQVGGAKKKPKGNDIWSTDEVAMESNIAPAPKAKVAPTPVSTTTAGMSPESTGTHPSMATVTNAVSVDRRTSPEHEILYKQTNTAEDVYLSMDFTRDGSTAMSCDQLAVKVQLPLLDKGVSDIELDVDRFLMTLRTRDYLLKATLPSRVCPRRARPRGMRPPRC
jgi:hypothetical protein